MVPVGTWEEKTVLVVVKTYPTPAQRGIEVSCTAAITDDGRWIRLFPIPFRLLEDSRRFKKYQWVKLKVKKASDARPESYYIDADSIQIIGEPLSSAKAWRARKEIVEPLRKHCMCCIQEEYAELGHPTLGFFRPHKILSFRMEPDAPEWSEQQLARLQQTNFFDKSPTARLEKLPYKFRYTYSCEHSSCNSHSMICTDWEIGQAFRRWKKDYGDNWEEKFRLRFESELIEKNDTHFFVGTVNNHPGSWIIIGLFYPPVELQPVLL